MGSTAERHRVVSTITRSRASRLYLAVCAALVVWVVVDSVFVTHADASFAGVVPLLFTAPASLLFLVLPGDSVLTYGVAVLVGALVNAWVIGTVARGARRLSAHA